MLSILYNQQGKRRNFSRFWILCTLYFNSSLWISVAGMGISCDTRANQYWGSNQYWAFESGKSYFVRCEESCNFAGKSIWGCPSRNGWVTYDSPICMAARMLNIPINKPFYMHRSGGQNSYQSCTMNGITSKSYGSYDGSFQIHQGKDFSKQARISIRWKQIAEYDHMINPLPPNNHTFIFRMVRYWFRL